MFSWIGGKLFTILDGYVFSVITQLTMGVAALAMTLSTIWVLLFGWAVLRGDAHDPIPTFLWKAFKITMILAVALQANVYMSVVADTASSLATGLASTFLPATVDSSTVTGPYQLLDAFNNRAGELTLELLKESSIWRIDLLFAVVVFSFGSFAFVLVALYVVTLAKAYLTFVLAIGPLFVLCLAWRPSQRFFDSWLSMLLNSVALSLFAFFALGVSIGLGTEILTVARDNGGLLNSAINVVGATVGYCIVMVLFALVCYQAPTLASGLTGGPVVQMGLQIVQNYMIARGIRQNHTSNTDASQKGGSITRGAGAAYTVGKALGDLGRDAARRTQTAAYKLAALRGRTRR